MNIFLPYERNLKKSVQCLDDLRLNKQILECVQLLTAYTRKYINQEEKVGYTNHPVFKHFSSTQVNLCALTKYAYESCIEYYHRFKQQHKLYKTILEFKYNMFDYSDDVDFIYEPYFMRGSLGQPEYVRTTENVSQLFQNRLIEKWKNDKRAPKWTNREEPEFWRTNKQL